MLTTACSLASRVGESSTDADATPSLATVVGDPFAVAAEAAAVVAVDPLAVADTCPFTALLWLVLLVLLFVLCSPEEFAQSPDPSIDPEAALAALAASSLLLCCFLLAAALVEGDGPVTKSSKFQSSASLCSLLLLGDELRMSPPLYWMILRGPRAFGHD